MWYRTLQDKLSCVFVRSLVVICCLLSILILSRQEAEAAVLIGANDFITGNLPDQRNVEHNIGFIIPSNTARELQASDYVIITFTNYSDVTLPTKSTGWTTGTPTYSRDGRRILITGVTAVKRTGITISGITATNPEAGASTFITIQTASDQFGTIVYDQVIIEPTIYKSVITTSLTIERIISSLQFTGYTSPNALVTIRLNGGVAGTTIANSSGLFDKRITGLDPDTVFDVSIYSQDRNMVDSQSVNFTTLTIPHMNFLMSNIVIPTTIGLNVNDFYMGDTMIISGMAHPYSQVALWIGGSNEHAVTLQVNSTGIWSFRYNSLDLPLTAGTHRVIAQEIVPGGYTSIVTSPLNFNLRYCRIADLNCDDKVNLTDFSIMMYYWYRTDPPNRRVDINKDGIVNETDFSLLMYYWSD